MPERLSVIVTCEHGGNTVPPEYRSLFRGRGRLLGSHKGYDAGALALARKISSTLGCPLYHSTVTRLLVDLNRSPDNPRRFSELTSALGREEKEEIETLYYRPYRDSVESDVARLVNAGRKVLHLSVHTFTPVRMGKRRRADLGLLYDPSRGAELEFCLRLKGALLALDGSLRVRRNYPYRGASDGFATCLRGVFPGKTYLGIELEVNQKMLKGPSGRWRKFMSQAAKAISTAMA